MIEALIALVLAGLCIVGVQYSPPTQWIYSMGLLALPLIYVAFALYGDSGTVAMKELMWGIPWILIGILVTANFFKWSGYVLAAGWAFHGSYDLNHELFL